MTNRNAYLSVPTRSTWGRRGSAVRQPHAKSRDRLLREDAQTWRPLWTGFPKGIWAPGKNNSLWMPGVDLDIGIRA